MANTRASESDKPSNPQTGAGISPDETIQTYLPIEIHPYNDDSLASINLNDNMEYLASLYMPLIPYKENITTINNLVKTINEIKDQFDAQVKFNEKDEILKNYIENQETYLRDLPELHFHLKEAKSKTTLILEAIKNDFSKVFIEYKSLLHKSNYIKSVLISTLYIAVGEYHKQTFTQKKLTDKANKIKSFNQRFEGFISLDEDGNFPPFVICYQELNEKYSSLPELTTFINDLLAVKCNTSTGRNSDKQKTLVSALNKAAENLKNDPKLGLASLPFQAWYKSLIPAGFQLLPASTQLLTKDDDREKTAKEIVKKDIYQDFAKYTNVSLISFLNRAETLKERFDIFLIALSKQTAFRKLQNEAHSIKESALNSVDPQATTEIDFETFSQILAEKENKLVEKYHAFEKELHKTNPSHPALKMVLSTPKNDTNSDSDEETIPLNFASYVSNLTTSIKENCQEIIKTENTISNIQLNIENERSEAQKKGVEEKYKPRLDGLFLQLQEELKTLNDLEDKLNLGLEDFKLNARQNALKQHKEIQSTRIQTALLRYFHDEQVLEEINDPSDKQITRHIELYRQNRQLLTELNNRSFDTKNDLIYSDLEFNKSQIKTTIRYLKAMHDAITAVYNQKHSITINPEPYQNIPAGIQSSMVQPKEQTQNQRGFFARHWKAILVGTAIGLTVSVFVVASICTLGLLPAAAGVAAAIGIAGTIGVKAIAGCAILAAASGLLTTVASFICAGIYNCCKPKGKKIKNKKPASPENDHANNDHSSDGPGPDSGPATRPAFNQQQIQTALENQKPIAPTRKKPSVSDEISQTQEGSPSKVGSNPSVLYASKWEKEEIQSFPSITKTYTA